MAHPIVKHLEDFRAQKSDLLHQDFLLTWEHSRSQLEAILSLAEVLKQLHAGGVSYRAFDTGLAISIFRDNSTRTRFSFASAANALGLGLSDLDEEKSQIAHGETVRETANMISFLAEVIGIRDDMFLGEGNKYMREVGNALTEGAREGVLHRRPSIVNLQCDVDHPTQALADLAWLKKHFGGLEQLRGKKLAMTWAYSPSYGKPLSVPQGVIGLMTRFGMEVTLAHPEGYGLIPEVLEVARKNAAEGGGKFRVAGSHGGGVPRRRRGLPEVLGALPRHAAAHPAPAAGRQARPRRAGEGVPGQQRPLHGLAVRPGQDGPDPGPQGALHALPARRHHRRLLQARAR